MWHHISVCPWKIDVCTWAEVWPSSGGLRKIMCVHYSNTTKLLSKDVFSRYSTRCSGLMLILNNIEIRTPSLESRALYRIGKTHVHSIDPSPAKPWRIWRGCPYKNLISKTRLFTLTFAAIPQNDLCPFKHEIFKINPAWCHISFKPLVILRHAFT